MVEKVLKEFEIKYLQVLDEDGNCDEDLLPEEINEDMVKEMYKAMIRTRIADQIGLKLQREGRMYTFASTEGQEAQVGAAFALNKEDLFFPSFRETGILLARGAGLSKSYQYWMGDMRGNAFNGNNFPISVPVGSQVLHAVGAAYAFKFRDENKAVLVCHGDGGTSEGDYHEAMNFAGVFNVPAVVLCQNNQWAISVPRERQCAAETLAQKAIGYGFEGIQIDGNDVFSVYLACKRALEKARKGGGPTFIEMRTYRMGDHTTSDEASRYRDEEEVKKWRKKDPIKRLEEYMKDKGWWSEDYGNKVREEIEDEAKKAVKKAESFDKQPPTNIVDFMFEDLTPNLKEQRKEIEEVWK